MPSLFSQTPKLNLSIITLCTCLALAACSGTEATPEATEDTLPDMSMENMELTADNTPELIMLSETFDVMNSAGNVIGNVTITDEEVGGVTVSLDVTSIPEGSRALHFHENGSCVTPDFMSAGGHYNPGNTNHGFDAAGPSPHAGDMPNFDAPASGVVRTSVRNERVTLVERVGFAPLFDENGSALIIHSGADDYQTQPTGAAGARIACAVITPKSE